MTKKTERLNLHIPTMLRGDANGPRAMWLLFILAVLRLTFALLFLLALTHVFRPL
jgi:hypothetical protein